ncbi:uncharacterized protein EAE97_003825 [Botrytis byssoidea]|uniref:Uncharacterized protein n=1 Tax=Botrytis byssoidea TaxID=139641 RepID=A0A9P5ITX0_9HELO|nr:uncharacterized protein EAE97_003825 [Botrytis byssoidea]KAF7948414.1 hypothetical protein EAE97_003825 [Botrytis byssoidea]
MSRKIIIKDPNLQVQSWTRCKLPIDVPLPETVSKNRIEDLPEIWHESLTGLMNAPGFLSSRCARNTVSLQEVLFAIEWGDDASFKAFLESPAYPLYLRGFGIHDSHIPNAMVFLFPSFDVCTFSPGARVTVFTYSFAHPAIEQNRQDMMHAQGLRVRRRIGKLGIHCQRAWIREPQLGDDGQLVENGVVLQAWPNTEPPVYFEAVDQDEYSRENLRKQVRRINPINMEEITWSVAKNEDENENEYENEDADEDEEDWEELDEEN